MKKIVNYLKEIGIINIILMLGIIAYEITRLIESSNVFSIISIIIHIIAYISGLLYAIYGYKKDAAILYKTYFWLFFIATGLGFSALIINGVSTLLVDIISGIAVIITLVLATGIDLGKSSTTTLGTIVLLLYICQLVIIILTSNDIINSALYSIENIMLAFIGNVFIIAKYDDKDRRGKY